MKTNRISLCALLVTSGFAVPAALAADATAPLHTVTPESLRSWDWARGGGGAKKETVEVDLVFNFMKGTGCSDADAKAAAAAAAKKVNELLKGACVKVNVKEVNNNWEGPGNMGTGADGEVDEQEVRKAKKAGLKEVTGDDGAGGTKKGYKVFIVKDFVGGLNTTVGCSIKCEPWVAVQKTVAGTTIGEILAHEMGHSFGKLDDTYADADMNCLMYGHVKPGSPRELKAGQGDSIRTGAKGQGRTVKKDTAAPSTDPKQRAPERDGSFSKQESAPIVNPAGEAVFGTFSMPTFILDPALDAARFEVTIARDFSVPDPTFIHMAIDTDNDSGTGVNFGQWNGVELYLSVQFDPITGLAQGLAQDLVGGVNLPFPVMVGDGLLYTDEFLPFPAPPSPLIPIDEIVFGWELLPLDLPVLGGGFGAGPSFINGQVSVVPDPFMLPGPFDDFFEIQVIPDDFINRPILVAPGLAFPGDVIPLDGFGFPPVTPVQIFIDDTFVDTVITDPFGQFTGHPLLLDPLVFGADGSGYNFLTGKWIPEGPAGTTWVEADFNPCPSDLNDDGVVNAADLAQLLAAWGPTGGGGFVLEDLNLDHNVNAADLAILLASWGPCP